MEENNQNPNLSNQSIQNSSTEQIPAIPPPPTKPKIKLPILISVILFLIAIGLASLFFLVLNKTEQKACTLEVKICPDGSSVGRTGPNCEFAPCPMPADETANWKTYTDSNFSFQYPQEALATQSKAYSRVTFKNNNDSVVVKPPYQEPWENYYSFVVSYENNPKNLSEKEIIDTYLKYSQETCSPPGCSQIKLIQDTLKDYKNNNVEGLIYRVGGETNSVEVLQVKGNTVYAFFMTGDSGYVTEYGLKIFDQILSTFKFTD